MPLRVVKILRHASPSLAGCGARLATSDSKKKAGRAKIRKKIAVGKKVLESTVAFAVCIKVPRGPNTCRISPGPPSVNPKNFSGATKSVRPMTAMKVPT
jgi:hypothetical protein